MKNVAIISFCLLFLSLSLGLSPLVNNAQAEDFYVTWIDPSWESDTFKTLSFTTAAISFDSEFNLYASDIFEDWDSEIKNILRLEPPDYINPAIKYKLTTHRQSSGV